MNRLKAWIRSFFGFSRGETNGFLILLPLLFIIIFSEPIYRAWFTSQSIDTSRDTRLLDSLMATWKWDKKDSLNNKSIPSPDQTVSLFRFNPNQSNLQELQSLGLNEFIAKRIINYRTKGGEFQVKSDLKKIYGIDSLWLREAYAYIDLPEKSTPQKTPEPKPSEYKHESISFDLNTADTTQLIKIYGIGSKLAARIIKYREKLGGFIKLEQLNEVYGLDSSVIKNLSKRCFIAVNFEPATIDLNQSSETELAGHPYLSRQIAKSITTYRFQHGAFKSMDDLTKIKLLTEERLQKMKPYFRLELPK
jgi:competence protein ComEA